MIGYVYILVCSKTDEIVYVGSSVYPLDRLATHKASIKKSPLPLYQYFRNNDSLPILEIIAKRTVRFKQDSSLLELEKWWMDELLKCGYRLLNQQRTVEFNKKISEKLKESYRLRKEKKYAKLNKRWPHLYPLPLEINNNQIISQCQ